MSIRSEKRRMKRAAKKRLMQDMEFVLTIWKLPLRRRLHWAWIILRGRPKG